MQSIKFEESNTASIVGSNEYTAVIYTASLESCHYATRHLVSAGCCVGVCCQGWALLKATHLRRWASPSVSKIQSLLSV